MPNSGPIVVFTALLLVISTETCLAGENATKMGAPVYYDSTMLILISENGCAAIVFRKEFDFGVTYRYRYLSKDGSVKESGEGSVFEKYNDVAPGKDGQKKSFEDGGSMLFIKAGSIQLEWSYRKKGAGWIYYRPENLIVSIGLAGDFERVDLSRFKKRD